MLAKKTFTPTGIGQPGTMSYAALVAVGNPQHPVYGFETFAAEVKVLEELERQRLVEFAHRHSESTTGRRLLHLEKFVRLTYLTMKRIQQTNRAISRTGGIK